MAHYGLTRRSFLGTSAAAMGASALSSGVLAQNARFRRWEISDPNMPTTVLPSYKKAIGEMLKLPPTDPRNWYRNAFVHVFDCPHGNWWFLPWHRAYLGWLERTCRDLSGDQTFALPYWDWTKSPRVPAAMFEDVLDPNNSQFIGTFDEFKPKFEAPLAALYASFSQAQKNALSRRNFPATSADLLTVVGQRFFFDQPEARGLAAANPDLDDDTKTTVAIDMITDALLTPSFAGSASGPDPAGFASAKAAHHSGRSRKGILESEPHDNVHGAIGGVNIRAFMVSMLSSVDPIFFLHHGNLDRLWDVWTPQAGGARAADAPARRRTRSLVGRAVPLLQRRKRAAGNEDQIKRLRCHERFRLRLLGRLRGGSGAGARNRCLAGDPDPELQRQHYVTLARRGGGRARRGRGACNCSSSGGGAARHPRLSPRSPST